MTPPTHGHDLLRGLPARLFESPVVCTQPEPWALVADCFPRERTRLLMVETMEHDVVRARTAALGVGSAVFGIGGGQAVDHAKYVAWQTGQPLVTVPSILSVDAAYTEAIGVREGQRVRYVGKVQPAHLLVDFGLLQAAPAVLNRAGTGDILSIFTALPDWRAAHERLGEPWDAEVAAGAQRVLDDLLRAEAHLRAVDEAGLRALSEAYVAEVALCDRVGNARPEEGSEHYIAYALESLTGGHYLHGQLIGLCVLLAGRFQGQDVTPIARFLRGIDLDCRFEAVGTSRAELRRTLLHMPTYVREESQLLPGVFHFREDIAAAEVDRVLDEVAGLVD